METANCGLVVSLKPFYNYSCKTRLLDELDDFIFFNIVFTVDKNEAVETMRSESRTSSNRTTRAR